MEKSPLIAPALEEQLGQLLTRVTAPVALICLPGEGEKGREMVLFLQHLARLSQQLKLTVLTPGEQPELEQALDHSLLPATGVAPAGQIPRMVFHGVPGGKEINAFAAALLAAGGAAKALDKATLKDIGKIRKPLTIQVCVSLGCQHCSQLVASAQRVALENPLVQAHMIDANLYPALVEKYAIARVPLTILNGRDTFPGGKTMAELTTLLARA